MNNLIFDKTDKGREEIATRQYQLSTRLRTLLVLVDGRQSNENLLKKVSGLGLNDASLKELADNGFIQIIVNTGTQKPTEAVAVNSPPLIGERRGTGLPAADPQVLSKEHLVIREGEHPFQALQLFLNETIKNTLGLRGMKLQYKANRASSLEDFRSLRDPYIDAVRTAKGEELSHSLRDRLDQLLAEAAGKPRKSSKPGTGKSEH